MLVKHYDHLAGRVLIADSKNDDPREVLLPPFINEAMLMLDLSKQEAKLFGYARKRAAKVWRPTLLLVRERS